MEYVGLGSVRPGGDLLKRSAMSMRRLEESEYQPSELFKGAEYSWPGDHEGRTVLALALLAQVLGSEPQYLDEILERIPARLNESGYFGAVLPTGELDEQQISGNSWFLRALVECYQWHQDAALLSTIRRVVEGLLLPALGAYPQYPSDPSQRVTQGKEHAVGESTSELHGQWRTSTDIGCAFIALDGAAHAYEVLRDARLKSLIGEMVGAFTAIDFLGLSVQTHATLSGVRGLLKFAEIEGDVRALAEAERIFGLYMSCGCTETYANDNWFGRPRWTEPCAVIDSFIVASGLWKATGKPGYLEAAHDILFNGLEHGQRANGGFGCDTCVNPAQPSLSVVEGLYEAFWCCTMRGGEGLARAVQLSYAIDGRTLLVPIFSDSSASLALPGGEVRVEQRTGYPLAGSTELTIAQPSAGCVDELRVFLPSWVDRGSIHTLVNGVDVARPVSGGFVVVPLGGALTTRVELSFDLSLRVVPSRVACEHGPSDLVTLRHGPLVLGREGGLEQARVDPAALVHVGAGRYRDASRGPEFIPIRDRTYMDEAGAKECSQRVLFAV